MYCSKVRYRICLNTIWYGSGIDVCRQLKDCDIPHEIPVLSMTTHFDGHLMAKTIKINEFIAKPFDIDV
ncbi:hypothetical protein DIU31_005900 [Mucilaginibacter rubeus]|uniref:Response regulatory domain-containing protein n=1 Tax=Mucilaginibacter rubeus TaxID=2027860 RepID=A0AAE6JDI6_9SPHI|nr:MULTISPECIES: hypothetical protein [Mucilaginibacter]QEM03075.1 hypothetical protein DIU31_005900 [Mucilaginibacter rubeus]QEM15694.1 hypothetical protein DIU38_005970 [Mucilaginibacter gossypii]QTE41567.1 hypothetical protein J3L19_21810 [Mucilaginibacter rubeus]QTE48173.1 hypothetical protein J3L21_21810 [Mucilaginibacter rubeus]QTE59564.1 hypothetical protein J3L23_13455 [Mucilaginibacter rubeus]